MESVVLTLNYRELGVALRINEAVFRQLFDKSRVVDFAVPSYFIGAFVHRVGAWSNTAVDLCQAQILLSVAVCAVFRVRSRLI